MGSKRPIISIEILTGKLRQWESVAMAAGAMETSAGYLRQVADRIHAFEGFVWCNPGSEAEAKLVADRLRRNEYRPRKRYERPTAGDGMVWLQLDEHTRIRVKPEEATKAFADAYRKKINRSRNYNSVGRDTDEL